MIRLHVGYRVFVLPIPTYIKYCPFSLNTQISGPPQATRSFSYPRKVIRHSSQFEPCTYSVHVSAVKWRRWLPDDLSNVL